MCLEAIAFACGEPAQHLRLKNLTELQQGQDSPSVTVDWVSFSGSKLSIQATMNSKQGRYAPTGRAASLLAIAWSE